MKLLPVVSTLVIGTYQAAQAEFTANHSEKRQYAAADEIDVAPQIAFPCND
jgi:hypothetical protein